MNLPTSQTNPDGFTNLPPNQKRRLRLMIRSASASEIYSFLHDDLQPKTALNPVYFAMLALSLLLVGAALAANSPLLLLAALLCAPFNSPLMGLTLSAVIPSWALMLRSFAALLLTAAAYFGAGWLSARLTSGGKLPFLHLLQHGWLEWTVLAVGSALLAAMLIRQRETPRLASALVTALVFFPLGLAGWALQTGSPYASSGLLQLCAAYAAAALLVALITFWAAGLPPRKGAGWVLFVLALGLTALTLFGFLSSQHHLSQAIALNTTPPPSRQPHPAGCVAAAHPNAFAAHCHQTGAHLRGSKPRHYHPAQHHPNPNACQRPHPLGYRRDCPGRAKQRCQRRHLPERPERTGIAWRTGAKGRCALGKGALARR